MGEVRAGGIFCAASTLVASRGHSDPDKEHYRQAISATVDSWN
jgi:hypothetical protein